MKTKPMSEAELQHAVLDLARLYHWRIARFPAANYVSTSDGREFVKPLAYDTRGFPDCILVRSRILYIEFKREKGSLSPPQRAWMEALLYADGSWHCWTPADWYDGSVEATLR